ncbi:MAG: sigma-54-dependent transcriptional regulator, partial [Candidatus Rokuibacteriota bacterium]
MPPTVLIVEDEASLASTLQAFLERQGVTAHAFPSAEAALARLRELAPDLVLVDVNLPGMDGLAALQAIREERPETLVVVTTAFSSVATAVAALKGGAVDYLTKPLDLDELWVVIRRAWEGQRLRGEVAYLRDRAGHTAPVESLLGHSPPLVAVRQRLAQVAQADRLGEAGPTVLITGETGTGKELVAQTVHQLSRRSREPFLPLNCGAVSPTLIESELFGHERGSFTGADRVHKGYFERANRGTLLLDEVTETPIELQVKLLRVLETGTVMRVGGTE